MDEHKNEMKEAGIGLGHAFKKFGKTFLRSVGRVSDKLDPTDGRDASVSADGTTVFSDGSWKEVGREFGSAITGAGRATVHTVRNGVDDLADKMDGKDKKDS